MRIWYVSHYAVPRECSLGWRSQYIAHALSQAGHEVTVWAASRHHWVAKPCGEIPFSFSRDPDNYDFRTIDTPAYQGNGLKRFLNVRAFSSGMKIALRQFCRQGQGPDLIIVSSPHPWVWQPLASEAKGRIKMIFEERDIWPLSLVDLAGKPSWHPLVLWLGAVVGKIYQQADAVISLLAGAEELLLEKGMPPGRFAWIPNGVDPAVFESASHVSPPSTHIEAIKKVRESGRLIVLYAGAMGPPNNLESVLTLAKNNIKKAYHFFLMGDGVCRPQLEAKAVGLDFITFLPPVKREEAWALMREADFCYHSSPDAPISEYGLSPNKIFDYFMMGKPIISVTRPGRHAVGLSGGGFEVPPGNPERLEDILQYAAALSASEIESWGLKGRDYVLEHHNWGKLGARYAAVCEAVAAGQQLPKYELPELRSL